MIQKFQITIGEPWDFSGADGQNLIIGTVVKAISEKHIVFKSDHILNFAGEMGDILILSTRDNESGFANLNSYITVNGALIQNFDKCHSIKDLLSHSKFVIVGGIKPYEDISNGKI